MRLYPLLILSIFFCISTGFSQNETNKFDSQNQRHGIWKKYFDGSKQLRYEGEFNHGKEIGIFKFYCLECKSQPEIIKTYNNQNKLAEVQFFSKKGKLLSKGTMNGKNRVGEWLYYHRSPKVLMTKENYKDGKLDGLKLTFYKNSKIAEELMYENGIKEGINNFYTQNGILLKKLLYENDELHGLGVYYDAVGDVVLEGNYKNGKKHGTWKTYKNGKFVKEEVFPKPRTYH